MPAKIVNEAVLARMVKEGATVQEIACHFLVKKGTIYKTLHRLGVETMGMTTTRLKLGRAPTGDVLYPPVFKPNPRIPPPPASEPLPLHNPYPCSRCGARPGACDHNQVTLGWSVGR